MRGDKRDNCSVCELCLGKHDTLKQYRCIVGPASQRTFGQCFEFTGSRGIGPAESTARCPHHVHFTMINHLIATDTYLRIIFYFTSKNIDNFALHSILVNLFTFSPT